MRTIVPSPFCLSNKHSRVHPLLHPPFPTLPTMLLVGLVWKTSLDYQIGKFFPPCFPVTRCQLVQTTICQERNVCAKMGEGCELSSRFIRGFAFPEISRGEFPEKRTTLRDTLNFRKFLTGIFLSIDSPPRNSGIFGSMFRFSEIQQCPDFEETFPSRGNFITISPRLETCGIIGWHREHFKSIAFIFSQWVVSQSNGKKIWTKLQLKNVLRIGQNFRILRPLGEDTVA